MYINYRKVNNNAKTSVILRNKDEVVTCEREAAENESNSLT